MASRTSTGTSLRPPTSPGRCSHAASCRDSPSPLEVPSPEARLDVSLVDKLSQPLAEEATTRKDAHCGASKLVAEQIPEQNANGWPSAWGKSVQACPQRWPEYEDG